MKSPQRTKRWGSFVSQTGRFVCLVPFLVLGETITGRKDRGEQVGDGVVSESIQSKGGVESVVHDTCDDDVLPLLWYLEPIDDRNQSTGVV